MHKVQQQQQQWNHWLPLDSLDGVEREDSHIFDIPELQQPTFSFKQQPTTPTQAQTSATQQYIQDYTQQQTQIQEQGQTTFIQEQTDKSNNNPSFLYSYLQSKIIQFPFLHYYGCLIINILVLPFADIIQIIHYQKTQSILIQKYLIFNIIASIIFCAFIIIFLPYQLLILTTIYVLTSQPQSPKSISHPLPSKHPFQLQQYNLLRQELSHSLMKLKIHSLLPNNRHNQHYIRCLKQWIHSINVLFTQSQSQYKYFIFDQLNDVISRVTFHLKNSQIKEQFINQFRTMNIFRLKYAFFHLYFKNQQIKAILRTIPQLLSLQIQQLPSPTSLLATNKKHSSLYYQILTKQIMKIKESDLHENIKRKAYNGPVINAFQKQIQFKMIRSSLSSSYGLNQPSRDTGIQIEEQCQQNKESMVVESEWVKSRVGGQLGVCYEGDEIKDYQAVDKSVIVDTLQEMLQRQLTKGRQHIVGQQMNKKSLPNNTASNNKYINGQDMRQKSIFSFGIAIKPPARNLDAYYIQ